MSTLDEIDRAQAALDAARLSAIADQGEIHNLRVDLQECQDAQRPVPVPPDAPLRGVNQGGFADFKLVGGPMEVVRVFDVGNWSVETEQHLGAGRTVVLSVKSDGNLTRAVSLFANRGVWLAYHHEPENDGISKPAWRDEQRKLIPHARDFHLLPITMAAGLRDWVDRELCAEIGYRGIGFDCYLRETPWNPKGFDANMKPCLEHTRSLGLPALLCEFGVVTKVNNAASDPVKQAAEIERAIRYSETYDVEAYCYFEESVTKDKTRDYRIAQRPLALAAYTS